MFELIVRLMEALAWPIVVMAIFLVLRKQLLQLLPLVRRLKAGPVEAEFEREVEEIAEETARLPPPVTSPQAQSRRERLLDTARINERIAIIDAWQGIEYSLKKAVLQRLGGSSPPPNISSPVSMIRELTQEGALDAEEVARLHELRGLRNQVTHLSDLTPTYEAAERYIDLAVRMQEKLDQLADINA